MSTELELAPVLRTWLRDRTSTPSPSGLSQALDLVAATPQRRSPGVGPRLPRRIERPRVVNAGRSRSLFTATRLVAATAIVALGTGALLFSAGGVPSPTPVAPPSVSPMPGPSLVTEMVEPGVVRVLGVRETASPTAPWVLRLDEPDDTAMNHTGIGPDGTVWILETDRLLRLDDPAQWPRQAADRPDVRSDYPGWFDDLQVAADGRVFVAFDGRQIRSFDGTDWTTERTGSLFDGKAADGAIWAYGGIARWADGRWTVWPAGVYNVSTAAATPDGVAWLGADSGLKRHDGTAVTDVVLPGTPAGRPTRVAAGPDGTLWVYLVGGPTVEAPGRYYARYLARLTADGWSVFDEADGVPLMRDFYGGAPGLMAVGPDGRVWLTPQDDPFGGGGWLVNDCRGVASFDGTEWTTYLQDACVVDLDVAPDGAVWVQTLVPKGDPQSPTMAAGPTYRITPDR